jgi:hypothetical protein
MSRQILISATQWRSAVFALLLVVAAGMLAALLITTAGQPGGVLLSDRFDEQWLIQAGVVDADRLTLRPDAGPIGLALRPLDFARRSFALQARVTIDPPGSAGLIASADDVDHFTAFMIDSDGYFRVSDYRNGVWIDRVPWRTWPHVRRGTTPNMLRAECRGGTCTFFVNDEWTWQEEALSPEGSIGLVGQAAVFDQISLRQVP